MPATHRSRCAPCHATVACQQLLLILLLHSKENYCLLALANCTLQFFVSILLLCCSVNNTFFGQPATLNKEVMPGATAIRCCCCCCYCLAVSGKLWRVYQRCPSIFCCWCFAYGAWNSATICCCCCCFGVIRMPATASLAIW